MDTTTAKITITWGGSRETVETATTWEQAARCLRARIGWPVVVDFGDVEIFCGPAESLSGAELRDRASFALDCLGR